MQLLSSAIFILGYLAIASEHKIKTSKSAIALFMGGLLWVIVAFSGERRFSEQLKETGADIFGIVVFLLTAMSLVEVLVHYKLFDVIQAKLGRFRVGYKKRFFLVSTMAFFLSAVLDNLTTAIVMIQIAKKFFSGKNLMVMAAGVVIAANAGGAFSPIGDVTTIMLWLAGKFASLEIIMKAFVPSLVLFLVANYLLASKLDHQEEMTAPKSILVVLAASEKLIIGLVFSSFILPIMANGLGLPPYLGLVIGLGIVWLAIDILKQWRPTQTHLDAVLDELVKRVDISSIKFFIGILLAVAALRYLGILETVSSWLYGHEPTLARVIIGNIGIGLASAILDNVPLAAMAIQLLNVTNSDLWILLALTLGTGGSLLVIGSAAGVVAMGMVRELNFRRYLEIATLPALVGFFAGIGVWLIQYWFF